MKHTRYAGNALTAYCAVMMAAFFLCPILAIPFLLQSEISIHTVALSAFCVLFVVMIGWYSRSVNLPMQLCTWYTFEKDRVVIRTLFQKSCQIDYANCADAGIGDSIHGVLHANIGTRVLRLDESTKAK